MIGVQEVFESRRREINDMIELMFFLETQEEERENGISKYNQFFIRGEQVILPYQALINILKSNVTLMIYNIIEFVVTNALISVYDELKKQGLVYTDVNAHICTLWRKAMIKATEDPYANMSTVLRKNEEIITAIIEKKVLEFDPRDTMAGGSLDGERILKTFNDHGIDIRGGDSYNSEILRNIKERRNRLAHGDVSFIDAVRDDSITEIKSSSEKVMKFLEFLLEQINYYIANQGFKLV